MKQYSKIMRHGEFVRYEADNGDSWGHEREDVVQEFADGLAEIVEVDVTPVPTVDEARQSEYDEAGATNAAMTVMLWEIMVEGRTPEEVGATALQVKRAKVKTDNPK